MDVAALGHIEQAVRLNLPLVQMLEAGRLTESGMLRTRLDGVCHELYLGTPIAEAVGRQLRTISQRSVSQIEAAEQAGCLAP